VIRGITHRSTRAVVVIGVGILAACGSGCRHSGSGDQAVARPQRVAGKVLSHAFDANVQTATIQWEPDPTVDAPTEIAVPARIFPRGVMVDCGGCTVDEEPGTVRLRTQPPGNPVVVTIRGR
jgi:hypothetical protein